tara:strand:- start:179 stop:340 length:162 start_codon:yes stop_codon:yes gene_type:complete
LLHHRHRLFLWLHQFHRENLVLEMWKGYYLLRLLSKLLFHHHLNRQLYLDLEN